MLPAIHELAQVDQWVSWRAITRNGKTSKVPYSPTTGTPANTTDIMSWATFAAAQQCAEAHNYNGIGFVFSDVDPYCGIDLDDCIDEAGQVAPWAQRIITDLHSYTEISPSGTGVKIFCKANPPKSITYRHIEIYRTQRYFTVTGRHLAGTPDTINDAHHAVDRLYGLLCAKREAMKEKTPASPKPARTDSARPSHNGEMSRIEQFYAALKAQHTIGEALIQMGARLVRQSGQSQYYNGIAGEQHRHDVTYVVTNDIGYSYSSHGFLSEYKERGFDVVTLIAQRDYQGDHKAMIAALIDHYVPRDTPARPALAREQPHHLTAEARAQRQRDAARKRAEREAAQRERQAWIEAHTARISDDETINEETRLAWLIHCHFFADGAWHCVSVAQMAALLCSVEMAEAKHIRRMQRANQRLIAAGYLEKHERRDRRSDGKQHTNTYQPAPPDALRVHTTETLDAVRVQADGAAVGAVHPNSNNNNIYIHESFAYEGGVSDPHEPAPPPDVPSPDPEGEPRCAPGWTVKRFGTHGPVRWLAQHTDGRADWYPNEHDAQQATWRASSEETPQPGKEMTPPSPAATPIEPDTKGRDEFVHESAPEQRYASYTPDAAWHITGERCELSEFARPAIMRRAGSIDFGPATPVTEDAAAAEQVSLDTVADQHSPATPTPEPDQTIELNAMQLSQLVGEYRRWANTVNAWRHNPGKSDKQRRWARQKLREFERDLKRYAPDVLLDLKDTHTRAQVLKEARPVVPIPAPPSVQSCARAPREEQLSFAVLAA